MASCGPCWAFASAMPKLSVCIEKRSESLRPLFRSDLEYVEFILEFGATTIVIPPHVGKAYDV